MRGTGDGQPTAQQTDQHDDDAQGEGTGAGGRVDGWFVSRRACCCSWEPLAEAALVPLVSSALLRPCARECAPAGGGGRARTTKKKKTKTSKRSPQTRGRARTDTETHDNA